MSEAAAPADAKCGAQASKPAAATMVSNFRMLISSRTTSALARNNVEKADSFPSQRKRNPEGLFRILGRARRLSAGRWRGEQGLPTPRHIVEWCPLGDDRASKFM